MIRASVSVDPRPQLARLLVAALLASVVLALPSYGAHAYDVPRPVADRESAGDLAGARRLLEADLAQSKDASSAASLATFLDRHSDPGRRDAFLAWAKLETDPQQRLLALRQAVLVDLMDGKKSDLRDDLDRYHEAGGKDLTLPDKKEAPHYATILLPGPLPAFARMGAIAPEVAPEDLLPSLARNVVTNGYQASGNEVLQQTEYLKLLIRYLAEAREIQALANNDHKIVIPNCDSEQTGYLLKALGYRMRGSCGADIALETVNPSRAFLTIDSGFPLSQLERDLRANRRFELTYAPTPIPVLYGADYWLKASGRQGGGDFIEAFTSDPGLCRMYLGLSHLDRATTEVLKARMPAEKLRVYANVLDFYGAMFQIRNGEAVVPGPVKGWNSLAGASPSNPGAFFERLLTTDDGWLAGYFDALSRLDNTGVRAYLTEPERMHRFYEALRGKVTSPGPARPVFRATSDLLLLTNSLRIDADGTPHVPGNLEVWRTLFAKHPHTKFDAKLSRSAASWRSKDDLIEAMFALSRKLADNAPLKIFLAVNDVDRGRTRPLSGELVGRLVADYHAYGSQYRLFADAPALSEDSINRFLDFCKQSNDMHDPLLRADTLGSAQAMVEIWSILARQNALPMGVQDKTFAALLDNYSKVRQESDLLPLTRTALDLLLTSAGAETEGTRQERLFTLLVGPLRHAGPDGMSPPSENFARMFDAQDLIPLDHLFEISDRLGKGSFDPKVMKSMESQLERLRETETLHEAVSTEEKTSFGGAYWTSHHITLERKLDLEALAKNPDKHDGRAAIAGLLRDTLVGIVYCYYAPPGAQILLTNPLFVRNHDFAGLEGSAAYWQSTDVASAGWPASAGGKLQGSLIAVPYALAQAEQNFLLPRHQQALIWGDLVPQMVINITIPRWRSVTSSQIRWIALNMERGRTLLASAALDENVMAKVSDVLGRYLNPGDVDRVRVYLVEGNYSGALSQVPPAVLYSLGRSRVLSTVAPDLVSGAVATLAAANDPQLSDAALAQAVGTPKPTLTHSYTPDLLYLRTFPALMGFSSRILAETWESNNLYYAALADEAGIPANELDSFVPEWNRAAIENIFAANLEDWPALIRSLQVTRTAVLHRGASGTEQASVEAPHN